MFGRIKADAWLEGYNKGMGEAEELREMEQQSDDNGITYASHGDYMKAKVAFNAKDTEIAYLKNKVKILKDSLKGTGTAQNALEADFAKCKKELEQFYLKAIGDCRTVKQVNAVVSKYNKSSLFNDQMVPIFRELICVNLSMKNARKLKGTNIQQAAETKIKRINRRDAEEACETLDDFNDKNFYVSLMAKTIKDIAGIEVDRTKILEAKQTGLDAWNVLLSLLSANGIKHDDVLGAR